jgi:hypothetical protein
MSDQPFEIPASQGKQVWDALTHRDPQLAALEPYFAEIKMAAARLSEAGINAKRVTLEWDGALSENVTLLTPVGDVVICRPRVAPPKGWLETYNAALSGGQGCVVAELAADRVHGEWRKP